MIKKNKIAIFNNFNCLNCGYPFYQRENYCPECGQKNKNKKITLSSFVREVFAGFFSWDAKFWRTLIPLLLKPGKVSKDYIEGKRARYSNPFRFYLTVSVIFFLIIGTNETYKNFKALQNGKAFNKKTSEIKINKDELKAIESNLDSIKEVVFNEINKQDTSKANLFKQKTDSLNINETLSQSLGITNIDNTDRISKFLKFQKKNSEVSVDSALDSLHLSKSFGNRFLYSRAQVINSLLSKEGESKKLYSQILSYTSIALFILLPLFALFLRAMYTRSKFTYVEHLIFVFHTQTVFFLLSSIFYVIGLYKNFNYLIGVFLTLFTLYLFMAMKKFYNQKYFKTFVKYLIANSIFFTLAILGSIIVSFIAFALY